jgi:hypothetical protein
MRSVSSRRNWGKAGGALVTTGIASVFVIWAAYINTSHGNARYLPLIASAVLVLAGILIWFGRDKDAEKRETASAERSTREFADVNAEYIIKFYREHSGIQAQKLVQPYMGKWLRVAGPLGDVGGWDNSTRCSYVSFRYSLGVEPVLMEFSDRRVVEGRLAGLPLGAGLTVIGRIDSVAAGQAIILADCELESVTMPDATAGVPSEAPQGPDLSSEPAMPLPDSEPVDLIKEIREAFGRDDYASQYPDGRFLFYEGNDFEGYGRILRALGLEWDKEVADAFECPAHKLNIIYVLSSLDSERFGWGT